MSIRHILTRDNLNNLNTTFFSPVFVTYFILLTVDLITDGFITRMMNLNTILLLAAISAFLMIISPPRKTYFADKFLKKFLLLIALLAGIITYVQTYTTGLEGILFSLAVMVVGYQVLQLFHQP